MEKNINKQEPEVLEKQTQEIKEEVLEVVSGGSRPLTDEDVHF